MALYLVVNIGLGERLSPGPPCQDCRYRLDSSAGFGEIAGIARELLMSMPGAAPSRRIVWLNVLTVISAAILIGAEVFGAAFAGSWAVATLFDLGHIGQRILDAIFVLCGIAVMVQFVRNAHQIEPFTARE
jgi:hypothetical protein